MRYSPRNIEISFGHAGLTHYGGILFFNEFSRMLQLRRFLTCLQGWTERILRRFHKVNPWRPEATFAKIERLMQTFWRQMLDFRPLLKEKSEIHDGSKYVLSKQTLAQQALAKALKLDELQITHRG